MNIGLFFDPQWAPCSLLVIQVDEKGQPVMNPYEFNDISVLVQTDYEHPGLASTFGWKGETGVEDIPEATEWLFDHASYLPSRQPAELIVDDPGYFIS